MLFRALSRYYRLKQGKSVWKRTGLLKEGKHGNDCPSHKRFHSHVLSSVLEDLKFRHPPPELTDGWIP